MLRDIRHAFRVLRRHPASAVTASLTLAVAIGASAVIFSVIDAAVLRPLPYRDPDRLVNVYRIGLSVDGTRIPGNAVTGDLVAVVRGVTHVFERVEVVQRPSPKALAASVDESVSLGGFGPGLPTLLGVQPQLGRAFVQDDVTAQQAIVLSDGYWQRRFTRDPAVIGKSVVFAEQAYVVVGVMPPTFRHFMGQADAWIAIGDRDGSDLAARLRPGLPVAQAQRLLDQALARLPHGAVPLEMQIVPAGWQRNIKLPAGFVSRVPWSVLLCLMGAMVFVLLIACANVANLLLAQTVERQGEIATRAALGATRGQLFRQFLTEGLLLAATGGVAAIGVAWAGIRLVPATVPASLVPVLMGAWLPQFDLRVLTFTLVAVLAAGVCSSTIPAVRASRWQTPPSLQAGARGMTGSRTQRNARRGFQAVQIALTVVLLVGGGLFGRSLLRMVRLPPGFDAKQLMFVEFSLPARSYLQGAQKLAFLQQLAERLSTVPGVSGVTVGPPPPASGMAITTGRLVPDGELSRAVATTVRLYSVAPNYFQVARIPLLQGRAFGRDDYADAPSVIIISENAANRLWPGGQAIGRRLAFRRDERPYTVVGVVPHLKTTTFTADGIELYLPLSPTTNASPGLLMRVALPSGVPNAVRAHARALDPDVAVTRVGTVERLLAEADPLSQSRFYALLFGALASTGLLTAAVGLYGLMAVSVNQRLHEIGVRVALGADRHAVGRLVVRDASGPVVIGLLAGLLAAFWLSRLVAGQLFQIASRDPATFVATGGFMLIASALALVVPVWRACHVDLGDALREE
jgi:putative ABC transport system permease protein